MRAQKTLVLLNCLALLLVFTPGAGARGAGLGASAGVPAAIPVAAQRCARRGSRKRMKKRAVSGRLEEGLWGGAHVRMTVRADGADFEFDCANGTLSAPLAPDADGRFDAAGTYTPEGHGPIRIGREPSAQNVRYAGRVQGAKMTLSVKFADGSQTSESFTLTRGSEGRLWKCR